MLPFALVAATVLFGSPAQETPKDLSLPEIIDRIESLTEGIQKLPWRCFTAWGDQGWEVFGRWERGIGLRSTVYSLSCSEDPMRGTLTFSPIGNKFLVMWTPDHVSLAHLTIALESSWQFRAPPHMLFRARRGDPAHAQIDPFQVPGDLEILLHIDEPLTYFQLDPRTMLGHEPGLTLVGREPFAGKDCYVLRSERDARAIAPHIPPSWYRALHVRRTFYVEADTFYFAGITVETERLHQRPGEPPQVLHETLTSTVRTRQQPKSHKIKIPSSVQAFIPAEVELVLYTRETQTKSHLFRRVVIEDCSS